MRIMVPLVFALAWHAGAQAQEVTIYGIGGKPCAEYLADRAKGQNSSDSVAAAQYSDWAYGYLTGYNSSASQKQIRAFFPRGTVIAYIDKYCREKPRDLVVGAIDCLIANYVGPDYPNCK